MSNYNKQDQLYIDQLLAELDLLSCDDELDRLWMLPNNNKTYDELRKERCIAFNAIDRALTLFITHCQI